MPPALAGLLALFRLLPAVSRGQTALLGVLVLLMAALPMGFIIFSGLLVGSIPAAVQRGLDQLTAAQHKAAESLYRQQAQGSGGSSGPSSGPSSEGPSASAGGGSPKSDVIDAEVVDEGKQ